MLGVLVAAKKLAELGLQGAEECHFQALRAALADFERRTAAYATVRHIRILRKMVVRAKHNGKIFDAELAPGDTATVIAEECAKLRCLSDDPGKVQFILNLRERDYAWEFYNAEK